MLLKLSVGLWAVRVRVFVWLCSADHQVSARPTRPLCFYYLLLIQLWVGWVINRLPSAVSRLAKATVLVAVERLSGFTVNSHASHRCANAIVYNGQRHLYVYTHAMEPMGIVIGPSMAQQLLSEQIDKKTIVENWQPRVTIGCWEYKQSTSCFPFASVPNV